MIDPVMSGRFLVGSGEYAVESLERRFQSEERARSQASQPDTDALYQALFEARDRADVQRFMKDYSNPDGDTPFRTVEARLAALQAVMARLKEEGLEGEPVWDLARKTFGATFGMNFMLAEFRSQALMPSDDEDRPENIEW